MSLLYNIPVNQIELTILEAKDGADRARQQFIAHARAYYNGDQIVFLTDRMREYLNLSGRNTSAVDDFNLNIIKTVVVAVLDELSVNGFDTSEVADEEGVKQLSKWARRVWDINRMNTEQHTVHEAALRDSESYILVDFDKKTSLPRWTFHEAFVDVDVDDAGNGCGIWLRYPDGDFSQPPIAAVKEWTAEDTRNGMPYTYRRRNVYYADRIEKYYRDPDWKPYNDETEIDDAGNETKKGSVVPWVDGAGQPLGIPVICFPNFGRMPEAKDALGPQDAVNKLFLDVLAEADAAFRSYFLTGAHATTDGQPLADDGSNQITIAPMTVLSTTNPDAKWTLIEGGDPTKLMQTLKDIILIVAQITGTPVSYFITTAQIAAADTLKGQDKPLTKKVEKRKDIFGQSWVDVMDMSRKVANVFGNAGLDETVQFYTIWRQIFDLETIKMMKDVLELPAEVLWRIQGLSEEQIQAAKQSHEYRLKEIELEMREIELAQMKTGANNQEGRVI